MLIPLVQFRYILMLVFIVGNLLIINDLTIRKRLQKKKQKIMNFCSYSMHTQTVVPCVILASELAQLHPRNRTI